MDSYYTNDSVCDESVIDNQNDSIIFALKEDVFVPNQTKQTKKSLKRDGLISLVGGVLLHIFLGSQYIWGNISLYVASYYQMIKENEGLSNPPLSTCSILSLGLPIIVLSSTFFMPIGSWFLKGKGDQSHKYK